MRDTSDESWLAPAASAPLDALVRVPGSKSLTNRAYLLAALASRPTLVREALDSRDTRLMLAALKALGANYTHTDEGVLIHPLTQDTQDTHDEDPRQGEGGTVELGNAGTVARFTPALAALGTRVVRFDGDAALRSRPISPVLDALVTLGADVRYDGHSALPFTVAGHGRLPGGAVQLDSTASSQFLSALLLIGPRCRDGVTVHLTGEHPPSEPHIAMTLEMLRAFGAQPHRHGSEFHVGPAELSRPDFVVEPDLSTAAPFALAPVVAGGTVRIAGWPESTIQPGNHLRQVLSQLGAQVQFDTGELSWGPSQGPSQGLSQGLSVTGGHRPRAVDLDLHDTSELTPVIAAALCFADGPSRISGVAHLRGHETDRLAALAGELSALGPRVTETDDGLRIEPAPLHGGVFETYDDHRLVMAAALLGLARGDIEVRNPTTVGKTFPGFTSEWHSLLRATGTHSG